MRDRHPSHLATKPIMISSEGAQSVESGRTGRPQYDGITNTRPSPEIDVPILSKMTASGNGAMGTRNRRWIARSALACAFSLAAACTRPNDAALLPDGGGGVDATPEDATAEIDAVPIVDPPVTAASPNLDFVAVKVFHFTWTDVDDATHYKLLETTDGLSGYAQVGSDIPQGSESYDHVVPLYKRLNARYILQSCNLGGCTDANELSVSGNLAAAIGYVKASNTEEFDLFGPPGIALAADGGTLAVGATEEDSSATGVGGSQADNSATASGAVYVFTRSAGVWSQQAYIKASNTGTGDTFGAALALAADGDTLAVGATQEDSSATGVGGSQADNSATASGAVYMFTRSAGVWSQQAYIKASNTGAGDSFGHAVALAAGGDTLAVAAVGEASSAVGLGGNQADNTAGGSGAVYIFTRSAGVWNQQAYVKASNTEADDRFGEMVGLAADGNTLAVLAAGEDSSATGVGGNQNDNAASFSGAVYVFTRSAGVWSQQAYIKASNTETNDFIFTVALSGDGNTLAMGAKGEDGSGTGLGGNQADNTASGSGAVYIFTRSAGVWSEQAYIKASNTGAGDSFGAAVALSADGDTLVVGAPLEASSATGLDGSQSDNAAGDSGAVYVFTRSFGVWSQQAYVKASNTGVGDRFGWGIALADDGETLAVAAKEEASSATGVGGNQNDNTALLSGAVYLY